MYPRPPDLREPPSSPPDYAASGTDAVVGLALLAIAGFAMSRFGFWWGIAVYLASFTLTAFVGGVNIAAAEMSDKRRRRARVPVLARLHAAISGFVSGVLGFGVAAVTGIAETHGLTGILAASVTALALDTAVGWILDADWTGALGSWCLAMLAWTALSVPLAAYIAPGYRAQGFAANAAMTVVVFAAVWPVWFASPWRHRWSGISR